jgi:hypothetical protein
VTEAQLLAWRDPGEGPDGGAPPGGPPGTPGGAPDGCSGPLPEMPGTPPLGAGPGTPGSRGFGGGLGGPAGGADTGASDGIGPAPLAPGAALGLSLRLAPLSGLQPPPLQSRLVEHTEETAGEALVLRWARGGGRGVASLVTGASAAARASPLSGLPL